MNSIIAVVLLLEKNPRENLFSLCQHHIRALHNFSPQTIDFAKYSRKAFLKKKEQETWPKDICEASSLLTNCLLVVTVPMIAKNQK